MANQETLNWIADNVQLVPAANFVLTLEANVDNERLSDEDFRDFVRNTLPIIKEVMEAKQQEQN